MYIIIYFQVHYVMLLNILKFAMYTPFRSVLINVSLVDSTCVLDTGCVLSANNITLV